MVINSLLSDVGLLEILLCAARTPALQKLFRTHMRTAPQFLMIAPAPALALFQKEQFFITFQKTSFSALSKVEKRFLLI